MEDSDGEDVAGGFIITVAQLAVMSPIWFIARCFGWPWTIVVERNGTLVREVKVRGWRNSERRIQELAESAFAGTLDQSFVDRLPTETSLPPEMNVTPAVWRTLPLETKVTLWRMHNEGQFRRR
jgi:hypothetical protein